MPKLPSVQIINIGDELLIGLRQNGHLVFLGRQLFEHGLHLSRTCVVRDTVADIRAALESALEQSEIVITTGGLGPTADDTTREALAALLEEELVFDESVKASITARFAQMGKEMSENNLRQCYRPASAQVLSNDWGTAPGLMVEYRGKWIILLPGPPHELEPMFRERVIPELRTRGLLRTGVRHVQLRCCGIGESTIENRLAPIVSAHPEVAFAYCAHSGIVDVRLSIPDPLSDQTVIDQVAALCQSELGDDCFSTGGDCPACALVKQLSCWDRTLAIAESCTGGLLSSAFTDVPGASKVFAGSVVCYGVDSKIQLLDVPECLLKQHGEVSAETAVAMATAAAEKFSTHYGLAITGFAGPGGGTAENPVGTIYVAHHSPSGVWCKKIYHPAERTSVKARAVNEALDWMRRKIYERRIEDALALAEEPELAMQ